MGSYFTVSVSPTFQIFRQIGFYQIGYQTDRDKYIFFQICILQITQIKKWLMKAIKMEDQRLAQQLQ